MPHLSVSDRVRVTREDEFAVLPVHRPAPKVHFNRLAETRTVERNVRFEQPPPASEPIESVFSVDGRLAATSRTLQASREQLAASDFLLADLRDLIGATNKIIDASQVRIAESDRVIARARYGTIQDSKTG